MSCYHCATGCQCGDIMIKVLKHKVNTCSHPPFLPPSPHSLLSFIILSPALAHLSPSGPHRLVVRVVGRPRPQALIGVEVHGVYFLPANLL